MVEDILVKCGRKRVSTMMIVITKASINILPHTCQLCLPTLSKLEFFSLALRKIALSLKSVFPILSSYLLIRSHSMFMLNEKERSSEEEVIRMMMMRTEEKSIRRR
jgi:hypothetical protein